MNALHVMPPLPPPPRASLPRRLGALLYDSLLLCGLLLIATAALLPFTGGHAIAPGTPWFSLYLLAIVILFFGWFWTHGGQTLGMRAWKLRLRRQDGGPVRWWQALVRLLLAGWWLLPMAFLRQMLDLNVRFSLTAGLLLFALTLLLRLHDRYSETEVVSETVTVQSPPTADGPKNVRR